VALESLAYAGRRGGLAWFHERRPAAAGEPATEYLLAPGSRRPPFASLLLLAPHTLAAFETMLQEGTAERDDWRRFLSCCRLVEGQLSRERDRVEVWSDREALPVLEALAEEDVAEVVRPGTGPALLPVPGGRVPLNEGFLRAIREEREFTGLAGEGVGRGALYLWAVPRGEHLNVVCLLHDTGTMWSFILNPCRVPAGSFRPG
jgi:hypothetical protein